MTEQDVKRAKDAANQFKAIFNNLKAKALTEPNAEKRNHALQVVSKIETLAKKATTPQGEKELLNYLNKLSK